MTIWLGYIVAIFMGGILLQRVRPAWRLTLLMLMILLISAFYYITWGF